MAEFKLSYTGSEINTKLNKIDTLAEKSELPTKISDLTNDSGFATEIYVDNKIAAIPTPDVSGQINTHNTSTSAHNDIRELISDLTDNVNKLLNIDYDAFLAFDTSEIIFGTTNTTSVLGQAILGQMVLA